MPRAERRQLERWCQQIDGETKTETIPSPRHMTKDGKTVTTCVVNEDEYIEWDGQSFEYEGGDRLTIVETEWTRIDEDQWDDWDEEKNESPEEFNYEREEISDGSFWGAQEVMRLGGQLDIRANHRVTEDGFDGVRSRRVEIETK